MASFRILRRPRGIALIVVLSILTMLALLAAAASVIFQLENSSAQMVVENLRGSLLVDSALEHAKALLTIYGGYMAQPNADRRSNASMLFLEKSLRDGDWINVRDSLGILRGRYRMTVEDEAGKLNVNSAWLLDKSKGEGWSAGEVDVPVALGVNQTFAKRILDYRYGRNAVPGMRGDDDEDNIRLMSDVIDNDADGLVDEDDEGVDDPLEYNLFNPLGDDRTFSSMSEVLTVLMHGSDSIPLELRARVRGELPKRATLYSMDVPGSLTLPNDAPSDLNAVTVDQCLRRLRDANKIYPFENSAARLNSLAANIVDYRDENDVLTTRANAYGVEAICFNELLANDGTAGRDLACGFEPERTYEQQTTIQQRIDDDRFKVSTASLFYNHNIGVSAAYQDEESDMDDNRYNSDSLAHERAWDIQFINNNRVRLLGPSKERSGGNIQWAWSDDDQRAWEHYRAMRSSVGTHGPASATPTRDIGFGSTRPNYETFIWPNNFFQNWYISIAFTRADDTRYSTSTSGGRHDELASPSCIRINSSDSEGNLTLARPILSPNWQLQPNVSNVSRAVLWGWNTKRQLFTVRKNLKERTTFQGLERGKYYLPVLNGWPGHLMPDRMSRLGFAPYAQLHLDDREHINHKFTYGGDGDDAVLQRASSGGYMDLFIRSTFDTRKETRSGVEWSYAAVGWGATFVRPEVIELINVSPKAISLRGWTLTFNTGSVANDIGVIDFATGASLQGNRNCSNPMIAGNGYFYLVNNTELFNSEYGTGRPDASWGGTSKQEIPVWEIPSDAWGVQYRIDHARYIANDASIRIYVSGNENFRQDQFQGEVFEAKRVMNGPDDTCTADGSRYEISRNSRNWIEFKFDGSYNVSHFEPDGQASGGPDFVRGADTVMILGMPAKGGVVSMTLKNQYKQITSRTVEYAYLDRPPEDWYGRSAEKIDPTHYNWQVSRSPTIGGRDSEAENRSMRGSRIPAFIKNGPFASSAELQFVRKAEDFENIGAGGSSSEGTRTLTSLMNVFGSSFLRLEAVGDTVQRTGWRSSMAEVGAVGSGTVVARDADWEKDQWRGHFARFLTGPMRGEIFPIFGNTGNSITLTTPTDAGKPLSAPHKKSLGPQRGDLFTVGPGYRSGLAYARNSNERGEWLWRRVLPLPGHYNLYIFGLNDAINTTEFLEENYNSRIDVEVYNYETEQFDQLCQDMQYGKEDNFYAGEITPAHRSPDGDVRIAMIAHDVVEFGLGEQQSGEIVAQNRRQTGYAWFNYAMITPVPVPGKINVNTAPERLIRSLPGMNASLARNIADGIDRSGRPTLKPYGQLGDLLNVKGMNISHFARIANLLMLDTSAFTFDTHVQSLDDVDRDGVFSPDKGDKLLSERRIRCVLEMRPGEDEFTDVATVERYRP